MAPNHSWTKSALLCLLFALIRTTYWYFQNCEKIQCCTLCDHAIPCKQNYSFKKIDQALRLPAPDSAVTQTYFFFHQRIFYFPLPWDAKQKSRAVPLIKRNLCKSLWQLHPIPSCQPLLISLNTHSALHSALEKVRADLALYSNTLRTNASFLLVEKEF